MAFDESLAGRIRATLGNRPGLREQKMFGGLTFMLNGNMCCGVLKDDLVVRVGAEAADAALEKVHTRPMDFTGRPLKGMVIVAQAGCETEAALRDWLERAVAFADLLPPK